MSLAAIVIGALKVNPCPAEAGYALPLQSVDPDQLANEYTQHTILIKKIKKTSLNYILTGRYD